MKRGRQSSNYGVSLTETLNRQWEERRHFQGVHRGKHPDLKPAITEPEQFPEWVREVFQRAHPEAEQKDIAGLLLACKRSCGQRLTHNAAVLANGHLIFETPGSIDHLESLAGQFAARHGLVFKVSEPAWHETYHVRIELWPIEQGGAS